MSDPEPGEPTASAWLHGGRVPSLDGLRGLSILLVLWHHVALNYPDKVPHWVVALRMTGDIGVDVFFVISGFLITLLLVRERNRTGRVSLRAFYVRRTLRIMPAYLGCFLSISLVLSFTSAALSLKSWLLWLTYTISFSHIDISWYIAHGWSLAVEEHFYLLWPALFCLLRPRALLALCVAYVIAAESLRLGLRAIHLWPTYDFFTPTRADAIACGCILALLATRQSALLRWTRTRARIFIVFAIVGLSGLVLSRSYYTTRWSHALSFADRNVSELLVSVIVWACVTHSDSAFGRLLNARPLTALGVLSYSIYLWQQPFLGPDHPDWPWYLPLSFLLIGLLATASFFLIERPFLRLKSRFEPTPQERTRSDEEADRLVPA